MSTTADMNIPFETLLAMLRAGGIQHIGVTAVLDIQKILATLDEKEIRDYRRLKYFVRPIVCRNKEDQEKFNEIFDRYVAWVEAEKLNISRVSKPKKKTRWWLWVSIALVTGIAAYIFLKQSDPAVVPYLSITQESYWPQGKYKETAIGDSVGYTVYINDTLAGDQYRVQWELNGALYADVRTIRKVYSDTGVYTGKVTVYNKEKDLTISDSITTVVTCDHPPILRIHTEKRNGKKIYTANPGDTSVTSRRYKYKWYLNDSMVSTLPEYTSAGTVKKSTIIKLSADTKGLYCSTDSLIATLDETPVYSITAKASQPVITSSSFMMWNAVALLGLLIIFPGMMAFYLYHSWKIPAPFQPQQVKPADKDGEKKNKPTAGPFSIEFKNQDYKIEPEEELSRLADGLRKRQLSDTLQLNLKKTIGKTIRMGGFPNFEFSPKTKPLDFLLLIDKEYPDSHLVKLFEYLAERLRIEQVNIIVYDYYKEPLYLNNKRFNHIRLPLDRLVQLYPDTVLLMFSNGHYLLEPSTAILKQWADEKLKQWDTRVIITPTPKQDWTYKESLLQQSGFMVLPADIYQNNILKILLDVISLQVETTKQDKLEIPQNYSARYYNFQDFDDLSKYLADDRLLEWISATAVYPHVDWKVTIAIGKAMEEAAGNQQYRYITFKNLLKISRISWMQDGIIDDELRLEMLRHINNTTEVIARKAIVTLLDEVKNLITENSFAKEEFDLHKHSNLFLLNATDPSKTMPDETLEKVTAYIQKGYLDWPQATYHQQAENTLLTHPGETRSVPLATVLEVLNKEKQEKDKELDEEKLRLQKEAEANRKRKIRLRNLAAIGTYLLLCIPAAILMNSYQKLQLWQTTRQPLDIILHNVSLLNTFGEISLNIIGDTTYDGKKVNDSSYTFPGIIKPVTDQPLLLSLQQSGSPAISTPITIDSSYNVFITEPEMAERKPLLLFYNNKSRYDAIEQQLTAGLYIYDLQGSQRDFKDSSRIVYYNNQKAMADSVASLIQRNTGLNIRVVAGSAAGTTPEVYLNLQPAAVYVCNPIAISALPATTGNIWFSAGNNRFTRIDLKTRLIYYSTGDKKTYGTYAIDEICLDGNGVYRITARANNQYQLFFLRNIDDASLSLSFCPNRYSSKDELTSIDAAGCGKFNTMALYFTNTDDNAVSANSESHLNFSTTQRDRLDKIFAGIKSTDTIKLEANINTAGSTIPADQRYALLTNDFPTGPTRAIGTIGYNITRNVIQWSRKDFSGTPFDRDYVVVQIKQSKVDPCSRTYYSMQEALSVTDPLQICRLNLEKEKLASLPAQLYNFRNMQELTLGTISFEKVEIEKLQGALPNCVINYTIAQPQQNTLDNNSNEIALGEIKVDQKNNPDKESLLLINKIARGLVSNTSNTIKLRMTVKNTDQQKAAINTLNEIIKLFRKEGVRSDLKQIIPDITTSNSNQQQQQQQQQTIRNTQNDGGLTTIEIIGTNWTEPGAKKAY